MLIFIKITGVVTEEVKNTFKGIKNGLYPLHKVNISIHHACTGILRQVAPKTSGGRIL
jgi:hypothetical protein